ncbi:MAG TPA: DUF6069 family protein [Anaerolineales bacterium]|nr:DUF6069 family protein [Anaerolineales bacterium]
MPSYPLRRLFWAGPSATLAAVLLDALYYLATKAAGETYLIPYDASGIHPALSLPLLNVIVAVSAAGLFASAFLALLLRFSRAPLIIFVSVALTAFILSLGGPFNLPGAPLHTKLHLATMHLLAAVILTGGILWLTRLTKRKS